MSSLPGPSETERDILARIAALADRGDRERAAQALAEHLGARALYVFVADPEIGRVLVPAPGFRATHAGGPGWRALLERARSPGIHRGEVRTGEGDAVAAASAWRGRDIALVFVGAEPDPSDFELLAATAPLVEGMLRAEHATFVADGLLRSARDESRHSAALTLALDAARADLERSADRTRHLQSATSALASALTTRDVADVLTTTAEGVFRARTSVAYFAAADTGQFELAAYRGVTEDALEGVRVLPMDRALPLVRAIRTRQPAWFESYEAMIREYPEIAQVRTPASNLQAMVALPLVHDDRILGGFALSFDNPRRFSEQERQWLQAFAGQCAVATERARLLDAERQARAEAETLFRVAESLNAAGLELETIVQRVTDEATAIVGANFGAFFYNVVDGNGESYNLYTLSGAPKAAFAKFGLPRNTPIFAPTFAGKGIVRLDDVRKDPRYGRMDPHHGTPNGHLPVTSYLAVPVTLRSGEVVGGLFFGHAEAGRFTAQHERVVKAIAASAAVAVDNARLFAEARRAEEEHARRARDLEQTVQFNEVFTGILGHDLRNPLGAILTGAQIVVRRSEDEKTVQTARRILSSGGRMARMIDQLLDFTRARLGGGIPLVLRDMDLGDVVMQTFGEVELAHPEWNFESQITGSARGTWDADRLAQVFSNLLGNAVQHGSPDAPLVFLLDGSDGRTVRIEIRNKGTIPAELLPTLFDPFRGSQRKRDGTQGLGLGLFITQQIVLAHGGQVRVTSTGQDGTTFTIELPRHPTTSSREA